MARIFGRRCHERENWRLRRAVKAVVRSHAESNRLIVSGPQDEVAQVIKLAETLDTKEASSAQQKQMMLRVVWLLEKSSYDTQQDVPADLDSTIRKLSSKLGFGELNMAAQVLVNVAPNKGGDFRSTGSAKALKSKLVKTYQFEVVGEHEYETKTFEIEMIARDSRDPMSIMCALSTSVEAKPGRPIILGMTTIDSKASLFVLEVVSLDDDTSPMKKAK